jgi:hypothetical protein
MGVNCQLNAPSAFNLNEMAIVSSEKTAVCASVPICAVTNKNIIVDDELAQKGRCFGVVIPSCDQ